MLTAQQLVEQDAQRVDVGGRGNRAAGHLLGRRVARRQHRAALLRQPRRVLVVHQLRDAEIQELHRPGMVNQHIRRFQIAMHDQVGVRVRHRRQHIEEQAHAARDRQPPFVAVHVNVIALDELEHEVGLAGIGDAGVDQAARYADG